MRSLLIRLALAGTMGLALGCASSKPAASPVDPFFGRTRVEPPPTGWASSVPTPDPYYSNTRQPGGYQGAPPPTRPGATSPSGPTYLPAGRSGWSLAPPAAGATSHPTPSAGVPSGAAVSPPTVTLPTTGSTPFKGASLTPSGQGESRGSGDRIEIPASARQLTDPLPTVAGRGGGDSWAGTGWLGSTPASAASPATSAVASGRPLPLPSPPSWSSTPASTLAGRERIVRVLEPRSGGGATPADTTNPLRPSASTAPAAATGPQKSIDIMELPPAGTATPYRGSQTSGASSEIQLVGATEPADVRSK